MTDRVRRNGLLSSCEPCRKSKLRCDHARPQCGRCVRRGLPQHKCHYHPAPMATAGQRKQPAAESNQMTIQNIDTSISHPGLPTPSTASISSSAISISAPSSPQNDKIDRATSLVGMHSLMTFADSNTVLPQRRDASLTRTGIALASKSTNVPSSLISEGVAILEQLLQIPVDLGQLMIDFFGYHHGVLTTCPINRAAWYAGYDFLKKLDSEIPRNQLPSVSQAIFRETSKPFQFPPSAANDALRETFCANNMRWDILGIYAVIVGQYFADDARSPLDVAQTRLLTEQAFHAAIKCDTFCRRSKSVNELNMWMLSGAAMLATWCFGDDSYFAWQSMGDLATVTVGLGFHKDVNDPPAPMYLLELRKRGVALVHELDKTLSTFVGRPPRLSRHFCVVDLPLDLSMDELTGSPEILAEAIAGLDENGWSKKRVIHTASRQRAQTLLSFLRDEVLELALGSDLSNLTERARHVLSKSKTTCHSIPFTSYTADEWDDLPLNTFYCITSTRMECLYSRFLLHKILVTHNDGDHTEMLQVSHDILSLVLSAMKRKGLSRNDVEWTMVFYAMPCASVLLLELFRQTRQPRKEFTLKRSTIIKDICALISYCDWFTASGESNYEMCKQAQSLFSRGLDQTLDYNDAEERRDVPSETADVDPVVDFPQDPEWTAWLETFGLEGDSWMDFPLETMNND